MRMEWLVGANKDKEIEQSPTMDIHSRHGFRKLQYVSGDDDSVRIEYNGTSHKIRHRKKPGRFNERFMNKYKLNESETEAFGIRTRNISKNSVTASYAINKNHSVIFKNTNNTVRYYGDEILKEKLDIHEHCYTTNEVLEIIAVTCLVNFIFWFLIISCVNFYTKKEKIKYSSWESLESPGPASEYELKRPQEGGSIRTMQPNLRHSICSSGEVFADEEELENNYLIATAEVAADSSSNTSVRGFHTEELSKWITFGSERSKGVSSKDWHKRKNILMGNSYSMENLIF